VSLVRLILLAVTLQRLGELWLSRRNTQRLLADGAVEIGPGHYPLLVALHTAWLASLWLLVPGDARIVWPALAAFLLLQGGRLWVLSHLGRFWTTRIISLPGAPLVATGPYRWCRHPNYVVVAGEIALLPLAFGSWRIALVFSLLNAALLAWRIRIEEGALALRRARRGQ
jgi:methyltransferase